jgi:transposase
MRLQTRIEKAFLFRCPPREKCDRCTATTVFAVVVLWNPGCRPLLASTFVASVADPTVFKTGRDLAAWIGLVPKQNSTGDKERLGSISRAGNCYPRMLVVDAMTVIRRAERHGTKRAWLIELLAPRATKVAGVALANKTARMIWA